MSADYRYWCGECWYRTPWLTESQGADKQIQHYAERHPGIPPGGRMQVREGNDKGGGGCLAIVGVLVAVLVAAATCDDQPGSAPAPPASCAPCPGSADPV